MVRPFGVSLDRLTILGTIRDVEAFRQYIEYDGSIGFRQDFSSPMYNWAGTILGELKEGSAFFQFNDRERKVRLEFNPKHAKDEKIKREYEKFLEHMIDRKFSRIDVAFDFDHDLFKYKIFDSAPNRKQTVMMGQSRAIETVYLGTRKSEMQIVLYDKEKERKDKGDDLGLPEGIGQWKRLEVRLMTSAHIEKLMRNWQDFNPFERFHLIGDIPKEAFKDIREWALAKALLEEPSLWAELNKNTKTRYRKLLKGIETEELDLGEIWEQEKTPIMGTIRDWLELEAPILNK